jgi:hypothetical protein
VSHSGQAVQGDGCRSRHVLSPQCGEITAMPTDLGRDLDQTFV